MNKFEYKSILLAVDRNLGIWSRSVNENSCQHIEDTMNELGKDGWELVAVFPVIDGGSPAQISKAVHHFKRQIND